MPTKGTMPHRPLLHVRCHIVVPDSMYDATSPSPTKGTMPRHHPLLHVRCHTPLARVPSAERVKKERNRERKKPLPPHPPCVAPPSPSPLHIPPPHPPLASHTMLPSMRGGDPPCVAQATAHVHRGVVVSHPGAWSCLIKGGGRGRGCVASNACARMLLL